MIQTAELGIHALGLRKLFGDKVAVRNLSLEVPRGEVFGFLGPNGAGKSTSVKMLLGLVTPSSGTASVLGRPVGDVKIRNARHRDDPRPLDERCACYACRNFSRAYLHYTIRARELTAARLITLHNLTFVARLMRQLRAAIERGRFAEVAAALRAGAAPEP